MIGSTPHLLDKGKPFARTGRKATGLPPGVSRVAEGNIDGRGCGLFNEPQKEHPGHGLEPLVRRAHARAIICQGQRPHRSAAASTLRRMDEDTFNMSLRKFLKKLGVTSQREIETAVREQIASGALKGDEALDVVATVSVKGLPDDIVVTGRISLT